MLAHPSPLFSKTSAQLVQYCYCTALQNSKWRCLTEPNASELDRTNWFSACVYMLVQYVYKLVQYLYTLVQLLPGHVTD